MALIEVKDLEKTYEGEGVKTPALRGVSFTIEKGEFVAIMGPSGSGKSTLLHALGFLDRPTGGIYRFDGKTIDEYPDSELARVRNEKMGFVFQAFNLLPRLSVADNVKLPLMYSDIKEAEWNGRVARAVDAVGLTHRAGHTTAKLSGGEKQRTAMARALVNDPEVIFADEPTGNLDSKSGQAVIETIQRLNEEKGHTVILITHETYIAEYAKRVIRMRDGKIESDTRVEKRRHIGDDFIK